jgi:hypothetical protein
MTKRQNSDHDAIAPLVEAMVDDILNASDEDILNEAHEDYGDAHKLTREVKRITASRSP